ncbi:MAG: IPT/TIG domain-containing protein [Ignavibacteria bacterium]|nr:IPT/TIG domain-containing protein [Ignavibacteria bacterium]
MNRIKAVLLPVSLLMMILMTGCGDDKTTTLWDPDVVAKPDPTITAVTPDSGLSGITELTITGTNFSAVKEENIVYFNTAKGEVLDATPTTLRVKAGVVTPEGENALVKVRVIGAFAFSNTVTVKLKQAVEYPVTLQGFEQPSAIEFDKDGNMYFSMLTSDVTNNIVKITPAGVKTMFTPNVGGGFKFTSLKMGPDGALYGVRNSARAIFRMTEGAAITTWTAVTPNTVKLVDIDFDNAGNLWACGDNQSLFRLDPSKVLKSYPFVANATALRVVGNDLYVAVKKDSSAMLYKFPINGSGDIDPAAVTTPFVNIGTAYGYKVYVNQFTVDALGNIYLATNDAAAILKVTPSGNVAPLYPGVLLPLEAMFITWDNSTNLYYSRSNGTVSGKTVDQTIAKVLMGVQGANYNGRR